MTDIVEFIQTGRLFINVIIVLTLLAIVTFSNPRDVYITSTITESIALALLAIVVIATETKSFSSLMDIGGTLLKIILISSVILYLHRFFLLNIRRSINLSNTYERANMAYPGDEIDSFNSLLIFAIVSFFAVSLIEFP
jgi:hypothetical protein